MTDATGYKIETAPLEDFNAYARNARTHSPDQIEKLAKIIDAYGWTNPLLRRDGGIVAGHGRLMAARKIYGEGRQIKAADGSLLPFGHVPFIDVSSWTEEQARAFVLLDNEIASLSGWDDALKASELTLLADDVPLLVDVFDLKPLPVVEDPADVAALMPETSQVKDTFWVTLSGPIEKQAKAMQAIHAALGMWPDLEVAQGTTRHD